MSSINLDQIPTNVMPSGTDNNVVYFVSYNKSANTVTFFKDYEAQTSEPDPGGSVEKDKNYGFVFAMTHDSEGTFDQSAPITWQGGQPASVTPYGQASDNTSFSFTDDNKPAPENDVTYHFTLWIVPEGESQPAGHQWAKPGHPRVPVGPGATAIGFGIEGGVDGFDPTVVNKGEFSGGGGATSES